MVTRHIVTILLMLPQFGLAAPALAKDQSFASRTETGTYTGTGRACAGTLRITAGRIVWNTPFSQCATSVYSVRDRHQDDNAQSVTFILKNPGPKCRYPVLLLTHGASADRRIGWNVVGFGSSRDYDPTKPESGLSCYLVK